MDKIQVLVSIFVVVMIRDAFTEAVQTTPPPPPPQTTTTHATAPTVRPPVRKRMSLSFLS